MARSEFEHLYNTRKWRRRSQAHRREHPLCARCEAHGKVTIAKLAHHVVPYQGRDEAAFFLGPLESLCHDCHEREHGRNPSRGFSTAIDVSGWPLDHTHPVYKYEGKQR